MLKKVSFDGSRGDYREELMDRERNRRENAYTDESSNQPKRSGELLVEAEELFMTQEKLRMSGVIPPIRDLSKDPKTPLVNVRSIGRRKAQDLWW